MKFFSEFGSCCRAPKTPEPPEGDTTLVPLTCTGSGSGRASRSERSRLTGSRVHSSTQWQPALSVISEDSAVSAVESNGVRTVRTEKKSPGKVVSRAKVREPSHGDEFRKAQIPVIIPAFSPTPFMF